MSDLHNPARGTNEWHDTYDDLGKAPAAKLIQLPLRALDPWGTSNGRQQPFKPYTPAMLQDLADNIRENGIIQPINVRPTANGRFEIIAGHNRVEASGLVGLTHIPALVQELDDDQATILMIDSNLKTRPYILPSEKALAYWERMEAVRNAAIRTVGRPTKNSSPVETNFRWDDTVAQENGVSRAQVQRLIRLVYLKPALLNMVDNGSLEKEKQDKNIPCLAIRAGVELSYLQPLEQELLLQVMEEERCKAPSQAQAEILRQLSQAKELDKTAIRGVLVKPKKKKPNTIQLPAHRIATFFPSGTSPEEMEAAIYEALLAYKKGK